MGASRLRPGVPTFHNDVGVVLRQSLVWDEAPGLFPALQPGPKMESWARLRGLHSASRGFLIRGSPGCEGYMFPSWAPILQAVGTAGPF